MFYHRRSIRLKGYDYSQAGSYFITICTYYRECLFGTISNNEMQLNNCGKIVETSWLNIPNYFSNVVLDKFIVMPNHLHGILSIKPTVGAQFISPSDLINASPDMGINKSAIDNKHEGAIDNKDEGAMNCAPTVGHIIRAFKARTTSTVNRQKGSYGMPIWQRNYYENIVRDEAALDKIRQYIECNPGKWAFDKDNPNSSIYS